MSEKVVYKPWGKEVWLELNDKYCYKRIYINAGTKTSYQYHNKKLETNFIIDGTAEVWLENDDGVVEKSIMKSGDYFTVIPPRKHRVIAITDIILQEVSTPEVDDVIRISDDTNRGDGKIAYEHTKPAFCILTAGIGSRLKDLSDHINKCLLPLGNKAIISHLIDKIPNDFDIVVALGYKGNMVREYCESAHPDRNIKFVEIDNYIGEGCGPAYSISKCKEYLQRPFIWSVGDILLMDNIPALNENWLGIYPTSMPNLYSTVNVDASIDDDKVVAFKNKGDDGYDYAFIGISGVYDYETFWNQLDLNSGEIVSAYYDVDGYSNLSGKRIEWYDIGTIDNYLKSKKMFDNCPQYSIPKTNGEFLYKINNNFIKLSSDSDFIKGRIERSDRIKDLIPSLQYKGKTLYSYRWKDGKTLYDCDDLNIFSEFLSFAKENMWETIDRDDTFIDNCKKFYYVKTKNRLNAFLDRRDSSFQGEHSVNGKPVKTVYELLEMIDWEKLYNGIPTEKFHGDLQFDNVIYGDDNRFYILDWRQDFGGSFVGDVYYDLSKMYGGIILSYKLLKDESNFSCFVDGREVRYDFKSNSNLDTFKLQYEKWLIDNNYDLEKVKTITALIFLNMSALHEEELGNLLFFKSKQMLSEVL